MIAIFHIVFYEISHQFILFDKFFFFFFFLTTFHPLRFLVDCKSSATETIMDHLVVNYFTCSWVAEKLKRFIAHN